MSSSITPGEIRQEFFKSKMGIAGIVILAILISIAVIALLAIPLQTLQEWNNPESWISNPKTAVPIWVNLFLTEKIPEHKILESSNVEIISQQDVTLTSHQFGINFDYDDFPNDFIYTFSSQYSGSPLLQISIARPDGVTLDLLSTSLPYSDTKTTHNERIFSTDNAIKKNLLLQSQNFEFPLQRLSVEDIVFSKTQDNSSLKGDYTFFVNLYSVNPDDKIVESELIIGGKAFGIMGTDELRRDLAIGLLWGTPLALFIGLTVSIASVVMGLLYGVYAGYKAKRTDEIMMRLNDVVYALPALPVLDNSLSDNQQQHISDGRIPHDLRVGRNSKSGKKHVAANQNPCYVDAANMMGQKDSKIILSHIVPQLLPYAFASIAISVPAAITTEAGLSFLGLGDPSFPTWGQILHDANTFGAAARGLWWWIMPPGVMIAITGLAFVFIGNALDAIVNPKLKR